MREYTAIVRAVDAYKDEWRGTFEVRTYYYYVQFARTELPYTSDEMEHIARFSDGVVRVDVIARKELYLSEDSARVVADEVRKDSEEWPV